MRSWDIWNLVQDQVRVGYKGAYALDLAAVTIVIERLGVDDLEFELVKMRKFFYETYRKE